MQVLLDGTNPEAMAAFLVLLAAKVRVTFSNAHGLPYASSCTVLSINAWHLACRARALQRSLALPE